MLKYIIIIILFFKWLHNLQTKPIRKKDYKKATILVKYIVFSQEKDTIKQ
jgi:hypothetical protein